MLRPESLPRFRRIGSGRLHSREIVASCWGICERRNNTLYLVSAFPEQRKVSSRRKKPSRGNEILLTNSTLSFRYKTFNSSSLILRIERHCHLPINLEFKKVKKMAEIHSFGYLHNGVIIKLIKLSNCYESEPSSIGAKNCCN